MFASADQKDASRFAALARAAASHMSDFNPQDLSNTVWAFPTVDILAPKVIQKVAVSAHRAVQFGDLLKFLWGYERVAGKDKSWARTLTS